MAEWPLPCPRHGWSRQIDCTDWWCRTGGEEPSAPATFPGDRIVAEWRKAHWRGYFMVPDKHDDDLASRITTAVNDAIRETVEQAAQLVDLCDTFGVDDVKALVAAIRRLGGTNE